MKTRAATAILLSLAVSHVGAAETVRVKGALPDALVHGETHDALANRIAQAVVPIDEIILPACGERAFELGKAFSVIVNDPLLVQLAQGGGVWHVPVDGTGCGPSRRHNVYLFDRGNAPIKIIATLPGDTAASLKLQLDAIDIVGPAANAYGPKDCPARPVVIATKIGDKPNGAAPWSEVWTFRSCAVDTRFRVSFTPDATGVGISARRE